MNRLTLTLIAAAVLMTGCASVAPTTPDVPRTMLDRPLAEPALPAPFALDGEAEAFVRRALLRSPDVAIVEARWRESAALARAAGAAQLPRVDLSAQVTTGNQRQKSTGDTDTVRQRSSTQQLGLDFQWELDLFGRLSSARAAAEYDRRAAAADLEAARVTLANVLRAEIVRLRAAGRTVAVAETMLEDLRAILGIEASARRAGLRSDVDIGQLRSAIAAREAELVALRLDASASRLRLRTLSDLPLLEIDALSAANAHCSFEGPVQDVPLRWLRDRRDVAAAEYRLQAGAESARSAQAALYPSVTLSGSLARERGATTQLTRAVTQSMQRSLALGLVGTLFDGGQRAAQVQAADARKDLALAEFQRTLLLAAEEVDGSIDRLKVLRAARDAAETAASESRLGLDRVQQRHASGIDSRLVLLQSRREAGERELLALGLQRDHCIAAVDLNRAIGLRGGPR